MSSTLALLGVNVKCYIGWLWKPNTSKCFNYRSRWIWYDCGFQQQSCLLTNQDHLAVLLLLLVKSDWMLRAIQLNATVAQGPCWDNDRFCSHTSDLETYSALFLQNDFMYICMQYVCNIEYYVLNYVVQQPHDNITL